VVFTLVSAKWRFRGEGDRTHHVIISHNRKFIQFDIFNLIHIQKHAPNPKRKKKLICINFRIYGYNVLIECYIPLIWSPNNLNDKIALPLDIECSRTTTKLWTVLTPNMQLVDSNFGLDALDWYTKFWDYIPVINR